MIKPRRAVMEMERYNPPTSNRQGYMRLDFNENTKGCSPNVTKSLKKIKNQALSVYPEYSKLSKELAEYCKVDIGEVLMTNGTDEAIKAVIEAYMEKGRDEIIIPVPTFSMFRFYAQLNEAVIKEVIYNKDLSFPTKKILDEIGNKTKILVLVNPNNPTGTSISEKDISKILVKAKKNNSIVLIDEAYFEFYGKTSIPLIKKYDNLIITRTFSKAFGLAGVRLGWLVSNKQNIEILQKVLSPYSVNGIACACAIAALKDTGYVNKYVKEIKENKQILYRALNSLGRPYYKSDANFLLLKIGNKSDYFCKKLKEEKILVRNKSEDSLLEGCVRITIGTKKQVKKLVNSLNKIIMSINPLLIFDIDGVLVDVSKSYMAAIKQTAGFFANRKITFKEIQDCKNRGGYNNDWDLTEALIKSMGKNIEKQKIIDKFQQYYKKFAGNEKWLLNRKILKKLSRLYNLAIFTGRPKKEAYLVLGKNKARKYFKAIVAMEDVSMQKPYPNGILRILENFPDSDAIYFGDTVDDMKAAKSAGIMPVGVLPPQDNSPGLRNIMKKYGAKAVLNDINKIYRAIK